VEWQVTETPPVPALEGGGGRELMRIVQECLANILHHAHATKVTFATQYVAETGTVRVTVRDDGRGFAGRPDRGTGGHGLANMQLRAQRLGGECSFTSDNGGTCVAIDLPTGRGRVNLRAAG
jgi:signal transduction histidine kinase